MTVDFNGKIDSVYTNLNTKFETLSTHVKKKEMQVVQIGDAIRKKKVSSRGVGDDVMKHHVNARRKRREAARRIFRSRKFDEFRRIALVSIDARLRTSINVSQSKSIDRISRASTDNISGFDLLQCREDSDSRGVHSKTPTSAQP